MRATLYEPDGFTEYFQEKNKSMDVMKPKRSYKLLIRTAPVGGSEIYDGGNYPGFPVVPLKNNRMCLSEISGSRNTIDALDLATSNMVNNVDEGNLIYWVLSNCGGMDDLDDVKFVERLKTLHVAHADGDDGAKATPADNRSTIRRDQHDNRHAETEVIRGFSVLRRFRYHGGKPDGDGNQGKLCAA